MGGKNIYKKVALDLLDQAKQTLQDEKEAQCIEFTCGSLSDYEVLAKVCKSLIQPITTTSGYDITSFVLFQGYRMESGEGKLYFNRGINTERLIQEIEEMQETILFNK